jgi:Zn-dependent metalloprotease
MKKNYLIFLSAVFIFLLSNIAYSQNSTNPFSVKKKSIDKSTALKIPTSGIEEINGLPGNTSSSASYQYKSIPFKNPNAINRNDFSIIKYEKNGLLMMAESKTGLGQLIADGNKENIDQAAHRYLKTIEKAMRIANTDTEFENMKIWTDDINQTHIKMQQYYKGVKVYGGQIILHAKNNEIYLFNGTYFPTPSVEDVAPFISANDAANIALENVSELTNLSEPNSFGLDQLEYEIAVSELVVHHNDRDMNSEKLAWHITLRPNFLERWEYFVDAKTSTIIDSYSSTCTDGPATANATDLNGVSRNINTYLAGGTYYMMDASKAMFNAGQSTIPDNPVGAIITLDANNTFNDNITYVSSSNNQWNEASSVSAHYNGSITYDYYLNTHGRNSINGSGGTIISIVNVADEDGQSLANAYWNGQAMFYGNGGGVFLPLAGGLDVAAHEMTHGVVQNTANLEYKNEPGAINESMADIAGAMVDRSNWQIGEDIIPPNSPYFQSGALRDLADPHNGGTSLNDNGYQPSHMNEKYTGSNDHGGVHINSGIINHAYYLLAQSVNKDKAEKIFYRALANYMTKTSQFIDCRLAFEQAAKDIYGNGSAENIAVSDAFYAVGIGDQGPGGGGGGSAPPGEIEVNPGQDYILSYDINPADQNTLYISSTTGTDFVPISTTALKRHPSLVDNGSVGVMITENDEMESITMTSPYNEDVISPDQIWDNAAVSKDGSRIAAITTSIDSAIWIYSYSKQQWAKFHLYSPTFTEGEIVNNVLYADALEWDYTGQYLVYDAYNELQNDQGQNIDYWDVGFIQVWDNSSNNWGNGDIFKLFSGLPEGVSIGNPSFSKNTPFIIAFDYFDQNSNETQIMGANLETGEVKTIYNNSILGFPNYSKLDDKIVFSTMSNTNTEIVGVIGLNADKISPSGNASGLIDVAKWPVWYATGNRDLLDVDETIMKDNFTLVYPNPLSDVLNVSINSKETQEFQFDVYNIMGQKIISKKGITGINISNETLDVSSLQPGTYMLKIKINGNIYNHKIIKLD